MILQPLPGDATVLRLLADELARRAETWASMATVVARLRSQGTRWESPAGERFGALVGEVPPHLDLVSDRYAVASRALLDLAAAMAVEQPRVQWCVEEDIDAQRQVEAIEVEITGLLDAGTGMESALIQQALARQRFHLGRTVTAREQHAAAWRRFMEVDELCAARLRAAAEDRLADPLAYRGLHAIHTLGSSLAALGAAASAHPLLKGLSVAGGVLTVASDVALLAGYSEGSLAGLGADAALAVTGGIGSAMVKGALQGGKIVNGVVTVDRTLSTQARLRAGLGTVLRAPAQDLHALVDLRVTLRTPSPWIPRFREKAPAAFSAAWMQEKRALLTLQKQRTALVNDWRVATAAGRTTQQMWWGGQGLTAAATVGDKAVDRWGPAPGTPSPRSADVSSRVCQRTPEAATGVR